MRSHRAPLALCLVVAVLSMTGVRATAQQQLPKRALDIRDKVVKIGVGERITVVRFDGIEHYGTVRSIGPASFEVAEVDVKQVVTDSYVDVKKVRKGYGNLIPATGKRRSPLWNLVAIAAIAVPLILVFTVHDE